MVFGFQINKTSDVILKIHCLFNVHALFLSLYISFTAADLYFCYLWRLVFSIQWLGLLTKLCIKEPRSMVRYQKIGYDKNNVCIKEIKMEDAMSQYWAIRRGSPLLICRAVTNWFRPALVVETFTGDEPEWKIIAPARNIT